MEKTEKIIIIQNELRKSLDLNGIKIVFKKPKKTFKIIGPKQSLKAILPLFKKETISIKEEFILFLFDKDYYVLGWFKLSPKDAPKININPKIIFSLVLKIINVNFILIAHNRLSKLSEGNVDIYPNKYERDIIKRIQITGDLLNTYLYDYLIVTPDEYCYSLNLEKERIIEIKNGGGFG